MNALARFRRLRRVLRSGRKRVDNLAGPCVVQLFARLVFDGRRIVLELVNMLAQATVLLLQPLHLDLQLTRLFPLVGKRRKSVVAEDHAISHYHGQHARTQGRHLAT